MNRAPLPSTLAARALLLVSAAALGPAAASCAQRAPRFADRPAVTEIADDVAVPMPRRTAYLEPIYIYELYVRRALTSTLDPLRVPTAGDVNARDDVPRSSWFEPVVPETRTTAIAWETNDGPPVPPLTVLAERPDVGPSLAVTDARGLRYELRVDTFDHPGLRTGAAAAGAVLMRALGYLAAETHVVEVAREQLVGGPGAPFEDVLASTHQADGPTPVGGVPRGPGSPAERFHLAAIRWPVGVDLGPPSAFNTRVDDPNDRIAPGDRRTLRVLGAVGAFVGMRRWDARVLRDAYVGEPGRGHVRHYVVSMEGAVGADAVANADEADDDPRAWARLLALGLAPKRPPANLAHPSLGSFAGKLTPGDYSPGIPYEPVDRALPEDLYWVAKRIAAVSRKQLDEAVAAGRFTDPVVRELVLRNLERRQQQVVAEGFSRVTPCEVTRWDAHQLELTDEARRLGLAPAGATRYEVAFVDAAGVQAAPPIEIVSEVADVRVPLPQVAGDYLVVRLWAERAGWRTQRPMEVHLALGTGSARVVAVRHGT